MILGFRIINEFNKIKAYSGLTFQADFCFSNRSIHLINQFLFGKKQKQYTK